LVLLAVNITSSLDWLLLRDTEIRLDRSLPAECGKPLRSLLCSLDVLFAMLSTLVAIFRSSGDF
jgi:hypothetical protein